MKIAAFGNTPANTILRDIDELIILDKTLNVISPAYLKMFLQIRKHVALQAAAEDTIELSEHVGVANTDE